MGIRNYVKHSNLWEGPKVGKSKKSGKESERDSRAIRILDSNLPAAQRRVRIAASSGHTQPVTANPDPPEVQR